MKNLILLGTSLWFATAVCAAPTMSVNTPTAMIGEKIELTLSDDKPIQNLPDLKSIENDFTTAGYMQSSSIQIINGNRSAVYQIIISLYPRKQGMLTIGPLDWNGTQLPAITVDVSGNQPVTPQTSKSHITSSDSPDNTNQGQSNRIFFAETTLNPATIYIGESTTYSVQLLENIGVVKAQIDTPKNSQFTLTQFGQDKMSQRQINGITARGYETSFLLTPLESGTFDIAGGGVWAYVPDTNASRHQMLAGFPHGFMQDDFFNQMMGNPLKKVYTESKPVTLTVKPKPADWSGWWLPSRQVLLREQFNIPQSVQVGQPIERHVMLSAVGVDGSKLPLVIQPVNPTLKAYANPEKRTVNVSDDKIIGYEEISFVIVPTQAGTITIPAIQVEWFNTETEQKSIAELPAQTIQVIGETIGDTIQPANTNSSDNTVPPIEKQPDTIQNSEPPITESVITDKNQPVNEDNSFWNAIKKIFIAFGVFELIMTSIVLIFIGVLIWLYQKNKQKRYLYKTDTHQKRRTRKKPLPDLYPFE